MSLFDFLSQAFGFSQPKQRKRIDIFRTSTAEGLPILYGTHKVTPIPVFKAVTGNNGVVSGTPTYDYSFESAPGSNQDKDLKKLAWLYRIEALCHGPIQGIKGHLIDGDAETLDRFSGRPHLRFHGYYGAPGQAADAGAVAALSKWTAAHRGDGVAYVVSRFLNDKKKPQFRGEPTHEVVIDGLKLYDPRQDVAYGGTGTQVIGDPNTWSHGENRVLIILNYLAADYGADLPLSTLDIPSFITAADKADDPMAIPDRPKNETGAQYDYFDRYTGSVVSLGIDDYLPDFRIDQTPGSTEQPRFTASAKLDPKTSIVDNVKTLLEGFGWSLPWSNGKHKLIIEDVADSVMDLADDEIYGLGTIKRGGRDSRLNRVTVEFPNKNKDYEQDSVSWPALDSTTFQTFKAEDLDEVLHSTVNATTITDLYRAEEWAEFLVRRSRADLRIEGLKVSPKALVLEPGDVITVTVPDRNLNGQTMIVERVEVSGWLDVTLDLLEYDPSVYDAEAHAPEQPGDGVAPVNPWADPPTIQNLSISEYHERKPEGEAISGFDLSWDDPENIIGIQHVDVAWRLSSEVTYDQWLRLPADSLSAKIRGLIDDETYDIKVTYTTTLGQIADDAVCLGKYLQSAATVIGPGPLETIESSAFEIEEVHLFTGEQLLDFELTDASFTLLGQGVEVRATGPNPTIKFPDWVKFKGDVADQVYLMIQRTDGSDFEFEELYLRWATEGGNAHGVSDLNRVANPARIASAGFSLFPFDASDPTAGDKTDWSSADLVKDLEIRIPTLGADAFYIPAIRIGRIRLNSDGRGGGNNLIPGEIATRLANDSDNNNRTYAVLKLANHGIKAGDRLLCSALQQAHAARQAQLLVRFRRADNSIIAPDFASGMRGNQNSLELAQIEVIVPAEADRLALILDVSSSGSGLVEGREPVIQAVTTWDDVLDTADSRKPEDFADVTWSKLVDPYIQWDFDKLSDEGWTAINASDVTTLDGWQLTATTADMYIASPDNLDINGSEQWSVIVGVRRLAGVPWQFERIELRWKNRSGQTFDTSPVLFKNQSLSEAQTGLVFNLKGQSGWDGEIISQIRLDLADAQDDGLIVDWVIVGKSGAPAGTQAAGAGNLFGPEYVSFTDYDDGNQDDQVGSVIFAEDVGLTPGQDRIDRIALDIRAEGSKGGRLNVRFFETGSSNVVAEYSRDYVRNNFQGTTSSLTNILWPAGANRVAVRLERENSGTGRVQGLKPVMLASSAIQRADVAQGATANLTIEPYDSGSSDYSLGDQVSDGGDKYIYVSETGGQSNALTNTAVWRKNADLNANADGVLQGYGVPDGADGSNGDYYLDLGTNLLYVKQSGLWLLWTPVRRNVGALAANDSATTDLIAFRAVTEQSATTRSNFTMGSQTPVETVSASIPVASEFAGEPVLARVSMIAECLNDSGGPTTTVSLTVGGETIDLALDLDSVGQTQQFSITRYYTPSAGTFTVTGSVDQSGGSVEMQAFTAEAVLFKR